MVRAFIVLVVDDTRLLKEVPKGGRKERKDVDEPILVVDNTRLFKKEGRRKGEGIWVTERHTHRRNRLITTKGNMGVSPCVCQCTEMDSLSLSLSFSLSLLRAAGCPD